MPEKHESTFSIVLAKGREFTGAVTLRLMDGHGKTQAAAIVEVAALPEFRETDIGLPKKAVSPSVYRFDIALKCVNGDVVLNILVGGDREFKRVEAKTTAGRMLEAVWHGSRKM